MPISGSIKARGGIYEVLAHAEKLALEAGLLTLDDDYSKLLSPEFKQFFSQYSIAVGSTGNLGLSIGIMSARIGFKVTVHMSADARAWKKRNCAAMALRSWNMSKIMVLPSRKDVKQRSLTRTVSLLMTKIPARCSLGIPSLASVLKRNLPSKAVSSMLITLCLSICRVVLAVVLVASHSGLNWRLAIMFTAFAEPTHSPCMLLGVHTGLHDQISVQDIGIDNLTAADGLAVGRASGFVGRAMERLLDGFYTLSDQTMYDMLGWLAQEEGIRLEPSALAGMAGPQRVCASVSYQQMHGFSAEQLRNTTHLVWATGGGMVPEEEMNQYLAKGR